VTRSRPTLHASFDERKEAYLAEPEFDALSLRQWRRETLVRYSNANQSEPIRILLFLLTTLALLGSAQLADALGAPPPEPYAAYLAGGVASAAAFADQRNKRTRRLTKIDRECAVGDLEVTLRPAAAAVFPGLSNKASLKSLRNEARVVAALCPDDASFAAYCQTTKGLRRRLSQSRTLALGVRADGYADSTAAASPARPRALLETFSELLTTDKAWADEFEFDTNKAAWFALSYAGRSVGSGTGAPDLLELLGSLLPPRDFVGPDPPLAGGTPLLDAQKAFYAALTSGDLAAMEALLASSRSERVSSAIDAGARLDPWPSQLRDDARPKDLEVGDADETAFDEDRGMTTCVEETANGATLLAVQSWVNEGGAWKLSAHETIPYAPNSQAGAVLKCDNRGCVALVRRQRGQMRE